MEAKLGKVPSEDDDYEDDFERDEYEDDFEADVDSPNSAAGRKAIGKMPTRSSFDIEREKMNFHARPATADSSFGTNGDSTLGGGLSVLQGTRGDVPPPLAGNDRPTDEISPSSAWAADSSLNPNEMSCSLSSSSHLSAMPVMPFPIQGAEFNAPVAVVPLQKNERAVLQQQQEPHHQAQLLLTPPGPQDSIGEESGGDRNVSSSHMHESPSSPSSSSSSSDQRDVGGGPRTALSAGGLSEAVLLPYHTQSIVRGRWKLGKKIGAGTFGTVHQGLNEDTGMAIAVKVLKRAGSSSDSNGGGGGVGGEDDSDVRELENEISVMRGLDHPNIVRYLGCQAEPGCLYIFQEWVPCGSVAEMLKNYGPLGEQVCARYLAQMLHGLAYLHDRRVVHRDLKGGNVLVNEFGVAKLADFGCSKRMGNDGTLGEQSNSALKGTPYFMAPEVIQNDRAGRPSDVWALAGVCFQMLTGDPPWKILGIKTPMVLFYQVVHAEPPHPPFEQYGDLVTPRLSAVMKRCFLKDPTKRSTARALLGDEDLLACLDQRDSAAARLESNKNISPSSATPAAAAVPAPDSTPHPPEGLATGLSTGGELVPPDSAGPAAHDSETSVEIQSMITALPSSCRVNGPAVAPSARGDPLSPTSPPPPPPAASLTKSQTLMRSASSGDDETHSPPPPHSALLPSAPGLARSRPSTDSVGDDEFLQVTHDDSDDGNNSSGGRVVASPPPADILSSPDMGNKTEDDEEEEDQQKQQRLRQQQQSQQYPQQQHQEAQRRWVASGSAHPGEPPSRPFSRRPLPTNSNSSRPANANPQVARSSSIASSSLASSSSSSSLYAPASRRSIKERRWGVNGHRSASAPSSASLVVAGGSGSHASRGGKAVIDAPHSMQDIGAMIVGGGSGGGAGLSSAPSAGAGGSTRGSAHRPISAPTPVDLPAPNAAPNESADGPARHQSLSHAPLPSSSLCAGGPGTPGLVREQRPVSSLSRFKARFQDSDPARRSSATYPYSSSSASTSADEMS